MIYNVVINEEYYTYFEITVYEVIDDVEYVRTGKIWKDDVFSSFKAFMEMQIKEALNEGVLKLF